MKSTEMMLGVVPRAPRNMGLGKSPKRSLSKPPSDHHFQIATQQASSLAVIKETKAQNETGSHILPNVLSAGDCTSGKSTAH